MNGALNQATEDDLRKATHRTGIIDLIFAMFEAMGVWPKRLSFLLKEASNPHFQALALVFFLLLDQYGYGQNIDTLFAALREQTPKVQVWKDLYTDMQQELPHIASEIGSTQELWQQLNTRSEAERETYLEQRLSQLQALYIIHKEELDAFWQRHPQITFIIENETKEGK
jgi:hypothetical protein